MTENPRYPGHFTTSNPTGAAQIEPVAHPPLLRVENLSVRFETAEGVVTAVEDVSFDIRKGEIFGLVGESGSGKSVTARSIMRLNPPNAAYGEKSRVQLKTGEETFDVLSLRKEKQLLPVRGDAVSMVFQDPSDYLAPAITIGKQMTEQLMLHKGISYKQAKAASVEMLSRVGIPEAGKRFSQYSFEFSGGMLQRAMIAMALLTKPKLLIADEPTTALDVTIQAQIIDLIEDLMAEFGMSVLLISHDLSIVARMADRVAVMYLGKICETGTVRDVIKAPAHPYTQGLIRAHPRIDTSGTRLTPIPGDIPSPLERPSGCLFHTRCTVAKQGLCDQQSPDTAKTVGSRRVHCHLAEGSGF